MKFLATATVTKRPMQNARKRKVLYSNGTKQTADVFAMSKMMPTA